MFRVVTRNFDREYIKWTDALEQAKSLIPQCRNLWEDIRIYDRQELVWIYSRSHKYPQYIGAGTYSRLAHLFVAEAIEEETKIDRTEN